MCQITPGEVRSKQVNDLAFKVTPGDRVQYHWMFAFNAEGGPFKGTTTEARGTVETVKSYGEGRQMARVQWDNGDSGIVLVSNLAKEGANSRTCR